MRVSILTPTRDRPGMLARAVASVLDQSYSDWELIVNDVGERSAKVVLATDTRIRYLRGEARGPAADFQRCLDHATGDLVTPLSDDDTLTRHALATAVDHIGAASWLVAATVLETEDGGFIAYRGGSDQSVRDTLNGTYMLGGAVYWRRELTDRVGGFRVEYDGAADFDLYARFARDSWPAVRPEVLYRYIDHPDTDSRRRAANQAAQTRRIAEALT